MEVSCTLYVMHRLRAAFRTHDNATGCVVLVKYIRCIVGLLRQLTFHENTTLIALDGKSEGL